MDKPRILIYGYGNPGRQDDALGILFCEEIEKALQGEYLAEWRDTIDIDTNYQLNVEDALLISEYDLVIFVDASMEEIDRLWIRPIAPVATIAFSTHAMNPESILALSKDLYHKEPVTYLLSIKGYQWELGESMTEEAQENLIKALDLVLPYLQQPDHLLNKTATAE